MTKKIIPITHPLNAGARVPGSKSLTNRALLISALAAGETTLSNALFSDDSRYFADALKKLGFDISLNEEKKQMRVIGLGGRIPAKNAELFIGNAGTAARFLTAFLTLGEGEYILDGDARMRERPIGDLVEALTSLGAKLTSPRGDDSGRFSPPRSDDFSRPSHARKMLKPLLRKERIYPPLKITASTLRGGKTKIAGNISSQYLSALLMIAPYARHSVEIEVTTELNSKPYVDMTLKIMHDFGVDVARENYQRFKIFPAQYAPRKTYPVESDASAASYFFAAPAICGGTVRVENISRNSVQGDINFLNVLTEMGCTVEETDNWIQVTGNSPLRGVDVNMRDISDTAQTLAVIAPFASTPTRIRGIASARVKETDRISAVCTELKRLGVKVEEYKDGMKIYPCKNLKPAKIRTYNDHRMAMAFSLIGLRVAGIEIENPACVSKTFPNYFDELERLREKRVGSRE